jgi:hypothetical protein
MEQLQNWTVRRFTREHVATLDQDEVKFEVETRSVVAGPNGLSTPDGLPSVSASTLYEGEASGGKDETTEREVQLLPETDNHAILPFDEREENARTMFRDPKAESLATGPEQPGASRNMVLKALRETENIFERFRQIVLSNPSGSIQPALEDRMRHT